MVHLPGPRHLGHHAGHSAGRRQGPLERAAVQGMFWLSIGLTSIAPARARGRRIRWARWSLAASILGVVTAVIVVIYPFEPIPPALWAASGWCPLTGVLLILDARRLRAYARGDGAAGLAQILTIPSSGIEPSGFVPSILAHYAPTCDVCLPAPSSWPDRSGRARRNLGRCKEMRSQPIPRGDQDLSPDRCLLPRFVLY